MLADDLDEVHVTSLEGLSASYRMKGFFTIRSSSEVLKVEYSGVAFGGNYGGHNVNVEITEEARESIMETKHCSAEEIEELITEVQRRMLNNELIVEYDKLKPETETQDLLRNVDS
ncbi:MAG: hypothetical protein ACRDF4_08110 [Rhabdochlamydiaceae bacterium]